MFHLLSTTSWIKASMRGRRSRVDHTFVQTNPTWKVQRKNVICVRDARSKCDRSKAWSATEQIKQTHFPQTNAAFFLSEATFFLARHFSSLLRYFLSFLALSFAASRVFLQSMATVMGPTPPGTGVIYPATFFTSARHNKCTSFSINPIITKSTNDRSHLRSQHPPQACTCRCSGLWSCLCRRLWHTHLPSPYLLISSREFLIITSALFNLQFGDFYNYNQSCQVAPLAVFLAYIGTRIRNISYLSKHAICMELMQIARHIFTSVGKQCHF